MSSKPNFKLIAAVVLGIGALIVLYLYKTTDCCKIATPNACSKTAGIASVPTSKKEDAPQLPSQSVGTASQVAPKALAVLETPKKVEAPVIAAKVAFVKGTKVPKIPKARRIQEAIDLEIRRTMDISLGYVPKERKIAAIQEGYRRQDKLAREGYYSQRSTSITNSRWQDRGPSNVSGRTRAILIDKNDPTGKTVFAGSATGGLWRTCNITSNNPKWEQISALWPSMAIGAMVQDPNNPQYIYIGTGDNIDVLGFGVYRSSNGGVSFEILPSTTNSQWNTVQEMAISPTTGDIYLATNNGVWRSKNQGDTWASVYNGGEITDLEITSTGLIYVGSKYTVLRSSTGDQASFVNLNTKPGFPGGFDRVEFSICKGTETTIFLTGADGVDALGVYSTVNGGDTWVKKTTPTRGDGTSFATPQAWYDLDIMVKHDNPKVVYVGGIDLFRSLDGGFSWTQVSNWAGGPPQFVHADQHYMMFSDDNPDIAMFGNDGGVFRTTNADASGIPSIESRIEGMNSTTFYGMGMEPSFMSNKFIAGAQDNGTNIITGNGIGRANEVIGGDGFLCFWDQNEPNIVIGSLYYGEWFVSNNGGASFDGGAETNSGFFIPADYDDNSNILYGQTFTSEYFYWDVESGGNNVKYQSVPGYSVGDVSTVKVDPNVANRIYLGTYSGRLYKVDNANSNAPTADLLGQFAGGIISSVDVAAGNSNRLMITISNYGASQHVSLSINGGDTWTGVQGDLPDMPVRGCLFNPSNSNQALIATEAGVWSSENLNGNNTAWIPPVPGRGLPFVRTDQIDYRSSDKVIAVATFGNGVWSSGVFSDPFAVANFSSVHYAGSPLVFNGEQSIGDENASWDFGDGSTSDQIISEHTFLNTGTYPISFSINGNASAVNGQVKILSNLPTPYKLGTSTSGGDFESLTAEQFGISKDNPDGSTFEFGNSTLPYKNTTHSGATAVVLGITEDFYKDNTNTALYTSSFDFNALGVYELSFWGKWNLGPGDGMVVEYSINNGASWTQLGKTGGTWYPGSQSGIESSPWPLGTPLFAGEVLSWTNYKQDVSFLSGNANVAFRFVFKSGNIGNFRGMVMDDIEITKYTETLKTTVRNFTAVANDQTGDIKLSWSSFPEFYCTLYVVEYSTNGKTWEEAPNGNIIPKGKLSAEEQTYVFDFNGFKDVYFFRLKVVNSNADFESASITDACGNAISAPPTPYDETFLTDPIVVRSNEDLALGVFSIFPNPFVDKINLVFNDVIEAPIRVLLFDVSGKLIVDQTQVLEGFYLEISTGLLVSGNYLLSVQIGEEDPQTYRLQTAN